MATCHQFCKNLCVTHYRMMKQYYTDGNGLFQGDNIPIHRVQGSLNRLSSRDLFNLSKGTLLHMFW